MHRTIDKQVAAMLGYATLEAEDSVFGPALYLHDATAQRDGTNCRVIGAAWERLIVGGVVGEYCVRLCPAWSTDIGAAWELVEWTKKYGNITIQVLPCAVWAEIHILDPAVAESGGDIDPATDFRSATSTAVAAPMAICLVILKATDPRVSSNGSPQQEGRSRSGVG